VCHVSLPSSYRSRRGHIHLPRVLPLVGCRSKTLTAGPAAPGRVDRTCQAGRTCRADRAWWCGHAWLLWHVGSISPINVYLPIKIAGVPTHFSNPRFWRSDLCCKDRQHARRCVRVVAAGQPAATECVKRLVGRGSQHTRLWRGLRRGSVATWDWRRWLAFVVVELVGLLFQPLLGYATPGFQNIPSDTYMYARIKFHTYNEIISE
jgi:hypothetical protein